LDKKSCARRVLVLRFECRRFGFGIAAIHLFFCRLVGRII
jgi:hypothetical protein